MNKNIRLKHILSALLVLAILVLPPVNVRAAEAVASGTCGENLTWALDSDGLLTVSGTGMMEEYESDPAPWGNHAEEVTSVLIESGVTSIGKFAFYGCPALTAVSLPDTLTVIDNSAFRSCSALTAITIPTNVTRIGSRAFDGCSGLTQAAFLGSAPDISNSAFRNVTADVSYPPNEESWNEDTLVNYGGTLTWYAGCLEHSFGEYVSNADATCSADGTKTALCGVCGTEDTVTDEGSRLPHSVASYESNGDATCITDGTKTGYCENCGAEITVPDEDSKLPHTYTNYISDNNATCADGTETALCDFGCGAKHTRTEEGSANPDLHEFAEVSMRNPSCTLSGIYADVCIKCGYSRIGRTVAPTGHSISTLQAAEATCTTQGYTGDRVCETCGYIEAYGEIVDYSEHIWDENPANWIVQLPPSYTHSGIAAAPCTGSGCSATVQRELPKLDTSNPFADVKQSSYAYDAIMWAVREDIARGKTETRFAPNDECTRAQIVTFLHRTIGAGENTDDCPFVDVKPGSYYYEHVIWASKNGITSGTDATRFSPGAACTRAQVVTFLWRAAGQPMVSGTNVFQDVPSGAYYYDAVLWAAQTGITSGTDATHFSPGATCTRAQIVTFLYRCFASSDSQANA